jgi:hypothetical protein
MELLAVGPNLSFVHCLNTFAKGANGLGPANHALRSCAESVDHQITDRGFEQDNYANGRE